MDKKEFQEEEQVVTRPGIKYILQLALVLGLGICLGLFLRFNGNQAGGNSTLDNQLSRFQEVYQTIENHWVDATDNSELDLETAAIQGFLNNIGDPHTTYFTSEELADFTSAVEGSFAGIGVTYSMRENGGLISEVLKDTPASKAGIQAGDMLIAVDETEIVGLTTDEVKALVTGKTGTSVKLTVMRDGEQLEFEVKREKIDSSVTYEIRDGLGYLDINTFGDLTDRSVEEALAYFTEQGIENIVIDLRDNTGGYLSSVQNILSLFVPKDTVLFSMQEKTGPKKDYTSLSDTNYTFKQGFILTNEETASASEVMAGALREILSYQLVGTTTYGKGTAQTQLMLSDMSSIKYTYAKWLLPSGECINGIGLTPDIEIDEPSLADFYNVVLEEDEVLKYDQVDAKVADMQHMLSTLGYDCERQDGYFSEATRLALMAFEKDHQLTCDGVYDQQDNDELIGELIAYFADVRHDACYQAVLEKLG